VEKYSRRVNPRLKQDIQIRRKIFTRNSSVLLLLHGIELGLNQLQTLPYWTLKVRCGFLIRILWLCEAKSQILMWIPSFFDHPFLHDWTRFKNYSIYLWIRKFRHHTFIDLETENHTRCFLLTACKSGFKLEKAQDEKRLAIYWTWFIPTMGLIIWNQADITFYTKWTRDFDCKESRLVTSSWDQTTKQRIQISESTNFFIKICYDFFFNSTTQTEKNSWRKLFGGSIPWAR